MRGDGQSPSGVSTVLPENCILHTLIKGDTPFAVAEQYGADPFKLMEVNGLNDETASSTNWRYVDCAVRRLPTDRASDNTCTNSRYGASIASDATEEATAEATEGPTATPTLRPTLTLPPTATNPKVEIAEVVGAGQITSEGITIRNNGNNVNLKG